VSEKKTNFAQVNLTGLLVAEQSHTSLSKRICEVAQSFAGVRLAHYQQRERLEQKSFESIVDKHYQQH
jgi:hypothetical protein